MEDKRRKKILEWFSLYYKGKEIPTQTVDTQIGIIRLILQ